MLQAVVGVHKTVVKEKTMRFLVFIVTVLLYKLTKYYQNRFVIRKIIKITRRGWNFWNTVFKCVKP